METRSHLCLVKVHRSYSVGQRTPSLVGHDLAFWVMLCLRLYLFVEA